MSAQHRRIALFAAALFAAVAACDSASDADEGGSACPAEEPWSVEPIACSDPDLTCDYDNGGGHCSDQVFYWCANGTWFGESACATQTEDWLDCPLSKPDDGETCAGPLDCPTESVETPCGNIYIDITCVADADGFRWAVTPGRSCDAATPEECALYSDDLMCGLDPSCQWLDSYACAPATR